MDAKPFLAAIGQTLDRCGLDAVLIEHHQEQAGGRQATRQGGPRNPGEGPCGSPPAEVTG
jgi:hypothetical protein